MNYPHILGNEEIFQKIHTVSWEQNHPISSFFQIYKYHKLIEEFYSEQCFDVIFYDAFGPTSQSHLWASPILSKMYELLATEGILVTYCAQGAFKRNLKEIGFLVENIPGPPGKREMTRAIKRED